MNNGPRKLPDLPFAAGRADKGDFMHAMSKLSLVQSQNAVDYARRLAERIAELEQALERAKAAEEKLAIIRGNAVIGPDPRMAGLTDVYLVPLDDLQS